MVSAIVADWRGCDATRFGQGRVEAEDDAACALAESKATKVQSKLARGGK